MPITEACSGLLFYFHHRWLCDRGTAVLQLLYRCRVSLRRLEIFRKTILLPGYGIKHERESRTPVGERLTRTESGRVIIGWVADRGHSLDSIDKPGFFKRVHKRKIDQPFGFGIYLSNRAAIDNLLNPSDCRPRRAQMWLAYSCQFASSKLSSVICANLP
jgi:hypothetical protein